MRVVLLLVPIFSFLAGCSMPQAERDVLRANHSLLQTQAENIAAQNERLGIIAQTQEGYAAEVEGLKSTVAVLGEQIKKQQEELKRKQAAASTVGVGVRPSQTKIANSSDSDKAELGRVEYVWLNRAERYLKARVDTGARSSSLNASNVQRFERDGERWVRFDISMDESAPVTMEAPILRHVRIRQASMDDLERRPVVRLRIELGEISEETEFTLSDRRKMLYPILLGRSFLQDIAVVDVAKKFTRRRDPQRSAKAESQ